ncbi:hypothetical protein H6F74_15100 [Trichocoleus sp. FACHB-90]|uniref:hypothetical protein n=1 Tax=Cyanophyceae TaxID=3028117 RepID=UPI001689859F|nr:hypothetical protein [Trichocoleus sp. FACHB-90]MBD1927561.1 hypothetical protein [Trichocoleus sp. FACHB-90]
MRKAQVSLTNARFLNKKDSDRSVFQMPKYSKLPHTNKASLRGLIPRYRGRSLDNEER